ncbi:MAG TPA: dienelactone hydrolase family protein [Ferrovibrio sp.]|jgi:carboxymethylenebutenolidase|uniref:dienelactone hydrolase family protein n=1 Tax=Ferrovibrio sp. TaxID=1917215 RepID=UPI002B4B2449|nr:dienelactone hydrolase family protein [Ferrovibrio sp.]HLT76065.1 dienelactone hydrolase family protein [Ferrovibrio sp.]
MGSMTTLTAADGHTLAAYITEPRGAAKGGLVVIQEIFGVNGHIRSVCDGFAADGYYCVAPALFDRVQPGVDLGYSSDDVAKGRDLRGRMNWADCMKDVTAAVTAATGAGRVGTVGYCYGGGVTWLAAAEIPGLSASVGYYGGPWAELADRAPRCPALLHFGARDAMIPVSLAVDLKAKHPTIACHVYEADHGFNCDQRVHYDAFAATLARRRTLAFFEALL